MRLPLVEAIPARILAPLLLAVAALLGVTVNYLLQTSLLRELVEVQQQSRVTEILSAEQTQLETSLMAGPSVAVQRHVASLGLHPGFTHALLVDRDGRVEAAMSRTHIGLPLIEAIRGEPAIVRRPLLEAATRFGKGVTTSVARAGSAVLARVAVNPDRHLIVRVDFEPDLSSRLALFRNDLLRETALMLGLAAVLALLLNVLWFHRTARLTATVHELGEGRLDTRTGLTGRDELGRIGAAIDRMAADLQARQQGLERLSALIERSPIVAIECLPVPGWPLVFAGGNIGQWGYEAEELVSRHARVVEFIHPEDLPKVEENVRRICDECAEFVHEFRVRDASGGWRRVSARSWVKRDASGEPDALQAVLIDVTARRQAEEAMRRQSDLLRLFYDLPFIGMSVASLKTGRWLQLNDRLCEILGYPREELMRLTFVDVTHPDDRRGNLANVERLRRGEIRGFRQEKRVVRKDGAIVYAIVDVRAVPHDGDEVDLVVATVHDITELKLKEIALQAHKEHLEQAEAQGGLGSWAISFDTGDVWWSAQMYALIGADPAREPPRVEAFLKRVHPDDREWVQTAYEQLQTGDATVTRPFRLCPEDGAPRWLQGSACVECDKNGRPRRAYGTVLDITALREGEESLRALNATLESRVAKRTAQLETANRELALFSYAVSHDLKAPLRGIDGYSQILLEDHGEQFDDNGRRLLANIRRGARQMHELIDDLLAYASIERRPFDPHPVDVSALVGATTEAFAREIADTGAVVTTDLHVPELSVDRQGLALVLRNLVGNALKFSRGAAPPRIRIGAETDNGRVLLRVSDNGIGFDMKYHARIFEIFQRLHRAEDYPGTGIGLALVHKAVERMGGSVRAESEPGRGATFIVELPR